MFKCGLEIVYAEVVGAGNLVSGRYLRIIFQHFSDGRVSRLESAHQPKLLEDGGLDKRVFGAYRKGCFNLDECLVGFRRGARVVIAGQQQPEARFLRIECHRSF